MRAAEDQVQCPSGELCHALKVSDRDRQGPIWIHLVHGHSSYSIDQKSLSCTNAPEHIMVAKSVDFHVAQLGLDR